LSRRALAVAAGLLAITARGEAQSAQPRSQAPIVAAVTSIGAAAKAQAARSASARFDDIFRKYTKRFFGVGFDWHPFKAQGMAESGLSPTATSWVGARGVMQLMPSTFATIQSARPEFKSIDDPEWNIAAGIMHDRYLWKLFERDVTQAEQFRFMFAAYNAGEGTIKRARSAADRAKLDSRQWASIEQVAPTIERWRYRETLGYVKKIETNLEMLAAAIKR
jgi:membrane-bound lytic murein transglycosylase MltF